MLFKRKNKSLIVVTITAFMSLNNLYTSNVQVGEFHNRDSTNITINTNTGKGEDTNENQRILEVIHAQFALKSKRYKEPPPYPHPFAGALDENQTWGYIHDPRILHSKRNNASKIQLSIQDFQEVCYPASVLNKTVSPNSTIKTYLHSDGYEVLAKVRTGICNINKTALVQQKPRIFCALYTYQKHSENVKAITETWGSRCDGFMAASTYTHQDSGTIHLPHFGEEGKYNSMWQKVRSMLVYIYTNFRHEYDYFHICGDDTYLVVDNLRQFVISAEVQNATEHNQPVLAGGIIKPLWRKDLEKKHPNFVYNGGGPGYTLNQKALDIFVKEGLSRCEPIVDKSNEDLQMSFCFTETLGLKNAIVKTREMETNAARYHEVEPNVNLTDYLSRTNRKAHFCFLRDQRKWRIEELGEPKDQLEAISNSSIAFHSVKEANYMRLIDRILYPQGYIGRSCTLGVETQPWVASIS